MSTLWGIFKKHDAELVEINPLALVSNGKLVALDAKLNLDDKSTARQSSLINHLEKVPTAELEKYQARRARAKELGIPTYIEMQGNMGVIADGAGTGMLTLDLVADYGGKTGVYCEMGGETTAALMEKTMLATLTSKSVEIVLINLIGGLNLMDEMAKGITSYLRKHQINVPIVVRMSGTREEEGRRILSADGIQPHDNLYEAVQKAVSLSGGN
jgi:succinyl-CoA synthetase beta subunit